MKYLKSKGHIVKSREKYWTTH